MKDRRLALIVASGTYADPTLRKLAAPPRDAEELAGVLADRRLGDFEVIPPLLDRPLSDVKQAIERFFIGEDCLATDLRLLYFSGHGVKDDEGRLYLATSDTKKPLLRSTAMDSRFVHDVMQASPCRQQVLLLDACYAGAMGRAMLAKGEESAEIKERFRARGRCVLAASDALQQAFEGDKVVGKAQPSIFTSVLVEGMTGGTADLDHDGRITFNELSSYTQERVRELRPGQTPTKFAIEEQGQLVLARAPSVVEFEFGSPPASTRRRLAGLETALDDDVPPKLERGLKRNCLLCTWNIRSMGSLTTKWRSEKGDAPKRNLTDVLCIAEIIKRFDVVVVSEARGDMKALQYVRKALGPDWSFTVTDVAGSTVGNSERKAFFFDHRRVRPGGITGEIAPPGVHEKTRESLSRAFADRPYAMTFESGLGSFTLVIVHPLLGQSAVDHLPHMRTFFEWLADWARDEQRSGNDLLVLGDFNLYRRDDPVTGVARSAGLEPIRELHLLPRRILGRTAESFYDHITYFTSKKGPLLATEPRCAGAFDFTRPLLGEGQSRSELTWHISDHYPLWVEFV